MTEASTDPLTRETPAWYDEAKLGIFIHWCPASIPAYAPLLNMKDLRDQPRDADGVEKFWRRLGHAQSYENALLIPDSPTVRHHAENYGDIGYDSFVDRFRDELLPACEPAAWADLCSRSGARYVVLTTKHQDGFAMWPSRHQNPNRKGWQSTRDVVGEAAEAVRGKGMRFGTYYCAGVDGTFGQIPIVDLESMKAAAPQTPQYLDYATAHWRELIDRYEPSVLWNDYAFPGPRSHVRDLFHYYLERVPDGVINNRFQERAGTHMEPCPLYCDFTTPEYSEEGTPAFKWETCRSVGLSFGYNSLESDRTYLDPTDLIHLFIDVVSRGGNLLLNINPTATGEIPWGEERRLLMLGWWLHENGQAIYSTRPWERYAGMTLDAQPVRYTASADAVHAIVLGTPPHSEVELDVFLDDGAEVRCPGYRAPLPWSRTSIGTTIRLPQRPAERPAFALRLSPAEAVHAT